MLLLLLAHRPLLKPVKDGSSYLALRVAAFRRLPTRSFFTLVHRLVLVQVVVDRLLLLALLFVYIAPLQAFSSELRVDFEEESSQKTVSYTHLTLPTTPYV